ncbi:hypothetical protein [Streptomyces sp. NPDC002580]|uniref:hypothetical protein n=1 Tax=Streptomyces sp. NPDC002580 TaxID=3364653 RepID=UPI0036813A98
MGENRFGGDTGVASAAWRHAWDDMVGTTRAGLYGYGCAGITDEWEETRVAQ